MIGFFFFFGPYCFENWGFQVNYFPRYWELTLRIESERFHRKEENKVLSQYMLISSTWNEENMEIR